MESVDDDTLAELESMNARLEALTQELADSHAQLKERLGVQEKLLSGLQTGFLQLSESYQAADARLSEDISDLRSTTDSRFAELQDSTDSRFAKLEDSTDSRFVEFRSSTDSRFAELQDSTDSRFEEIQSSIDSHFAEIQSSTDSRLAKLEGSTDSRFAEFEKRLQVQADLVASLRSDIERLEKDITDINAQFNQVISDQDELTVGRMATLMSQLNDLRRRVEELEGTGAPKPKSDSGASSLLIIGGLAAAAALLLGGAK